MVYQLRCKRGVSEKFVKVAAISCKTIEDEHVQQWSRVMNRCRIDPELFLDTLYERAQQIARTKHIQYDEATVDRILNDKKKIEFDAQKQSRMECQVQIGLTQMDISSIQKFEMADLAKQQKVAEENLHRMQKKEYDKQEEWFKTRKELYCVKEINRMNLERQKRDDAHALKYALEHEENETTKINPFERRACRPTTAWDTTLTYVEELEEMKRNRLAREARAKAARERQEKNKAAAKAKELEANKGEEPAQEDVPMKEAPQVPKQPESMSEDQALREEPQPQELDEAAQKRKAEFDATRAILYEYMEVLRARDRERQSRVA